MVFVESMPHLLKNLVDIDGISLQYLYNGKKVVLLVNFIKS